MEILKQVRTDSTAFHFVAQLQGVHFEIEFEQRVGDDEDAVAFGVGFGNGSTIAINVGERSGRQFVDGVPEAPGIFRGLFRLQREGKKKLRYSPA